MQASLASGKGDFQQASAYLDEAERLAVESGDYRLRLRTSAGRVQVESRRGNFVSARKYLEEYIQLGQSLDDVFMPYALLILAAILQWQGLSIWAARVLGLADSRQGANRVSSGIHPQRRRLSGTCGCPRPGARPAGRRDVCAGMGNWAEDDA